MFLNIINMDKKKDEDRKLLALSLAVFGKITSWIIGPLILALILGNWLDNKYQTDDRYLLISVAVAFIISIIGIFREALRFNKNN